MPGAVPLLGQVDSLLSIDLHEIIILSDFVTNSYGESWDSSSVFQLILSSGGSCKPSEESPRSRANFFWLYLTGHLYVICQVRKPSLLGRWPQTGLLSETLHLVKKFWVPFQNHWVTVKRKNKSYLDLKMPWPLCDQTDKRYSFVKCNKDRKKYVSLNNLHMSSHRNHTDRMFYKNILRSIDLCVLQDSCNELLWVFGDFYVSGVQDAEITKSLYTYCAESHPCAGGMRAFSIWVAMSLVAPLV